MAGSGTPEDDFRAVLDAIQGYGQEPEGFVTSTAQVDPSVGADPVLDAMTWESAPPTAAMPFDPGQWDGVSEEVDMGAPALSSPQGTPQLAGSGTSSGSGISASFRGSTEAGRQATTGFFDQASEDTAAMMEAQGGRFTAEAEATQRHYDTLRDSTIEQGKSERYHQKQLEQLSREVQDFNESAAELEERIHADGKVVREQILGEYREQLAGVRALAATSGNPLGGLGLGQAGAMGGAMFAQGFLAAQGIQIDVGGQIDKWVDRSIAEHQMKIKNAQQGAADTLNLYDIARQSSKDDWEARQRYRGFVIQGFQSAIQIEAARFGSEIAVQRAMQRSAELEIEKTKSIAGIGDRYFATYVQTHTMALNEAEKRAQASVQERELKIRQQQANTASYSARTARMEQERLSAPPAPEERADMGFSDGELVVDAQGNPVLDANGNRQVEKKWEVDPALQKQDPTAAREVFKTGRETEDNYKMLLDATTRLGKSHEEALKVWNGMNPGVRMVGWKAAARLDDTGAIGRYLQDREVWVMAKIRMNSGLAASENEANRHYGLVELDKLLEFGSKGGQRIANLRKTASEDFERKMQSSGIRLLDKPRRVSVGTAGGRTQAEDTIARGDHAGVKVEPGLAGKALEHIEARDSDEAPAKSMSGTWADFYRQETSDPEHRDEKVPIGQPEYAVMIDRLAIGYLEPTSESNKAALGIQKEESEYATKWDSYEVLQSVARGKTKAEDRARRYADMVFDLVRRDPEAARKKLGSR